MLSTRKIRKMGLTENRVSPIMDSNCKHPISDTQLRQHDENIKGHVSHVDLRIVMGYHFLSPFIPFGDLWATFPSTDQPRVTGTCNQWLLALGHHLVVPAKIWENTNFTPNVPTIFFVVISFPTINGITSCSKNLATPTGWGPQSIAFSCLVSGSTW